MYNKLFTKILDSSLWLEDSDTRIVWITLLAAMDKDGLCSFRSPAEVAIRARVQPAVALAALKKFESPDPLTPEAEHEGRRIERIRGGYMVLNAIQHREQVTREEILRQNAERARRYREKKKNSSTTVTPDRDAEETERTDITTPKPARENVIRRAPVTQSVSEAEAKQRQQRGRAAAEALAEETLQQAKALLKGTKAIVDAPLSNSLPSLFPRRDGGRRVLPKPSCPAQFRWPTRHK